MHHQRQKEKARHKSKESVLPDEFLADLADVEKLNPNLSNLEKGLSLDDELRKLAAQERILPKVPMPTSPPSKVLSPPPLPPPSSKPPIASSANEMKPPVASPSASENSRGKTEE